MTGRFCWHYARCHRRVWAAATRRLHHHSPRHWPHAAGVRWCVASAIDQRAHVGAAFVCERHRGLCTGGQEAPIQASKQPDNKAEESEGEVLFKNPAARFFRLLAFGSSVQMAFWAAYQALPEHMMLSPTTGYVGLIAGAAFIFFARHCAKYYVYEIRTLRPGSHFMVHGHTFLGAKGPGRLVPVGTTKMTESPRYIAFKVEGDTFWHLLDTRDGDFGADEKHMNRIKRILNGLRDLTMTTPKAQAEDVKEAAPRVERSRRRSRR